MEYDSKQPIVHTTLDSASKGDGEVAEITTRIRVTREQAEAFKSLSPELQQKLGPPVFGQVLNAVELRRLARTVIVTETSSTIMCPW